MKKFPSSVSAAWLVLGACLTLGLSSEICSGSITTTGTNTTGSWGATKVIDGVSNTDLAASANGATISEPNTSGSAGVGKVSSLIDGVTTVSPGSVFFSDGSHGDMLPNTKTITLNTSVNSSGYNLTSIESFAGWCNGLGRGLANQNYTISYSTVSEPSTFLPLGTVVYQPFASGQSGDALSKVVVTDSVGPYLATNVKAIQITFNPNGNTTGASGAVYNEIDIFGVVADVTALFISQPAQNFVVQRREDNKADVTIQGFYVGNPERIEARAIAVGGTRNGIGVASGVDTPWQTVTASPANGTYSGILSNVSAGGWYRLEVRQIEGGAPIQSATLYPFGVGDVFVTAGQSNSANHGSVAATPSDNRVVALNSLTGGSWIAAADPQPIATGVGGSAWSRFGDLWTNLENVPVALVSVGVGGTSSASWLPSANANYPRLRSAVKTFPNSGFRAILWHQGEADSVGVSAATYQTNLQTIIATSRADAGWNFPWYIAQASYLPSTNFTKQMPVAAGQRALAWASPNVFLGPRTDDFHMESKVSDGVHFNVAGLDDHASQWVQALKPSATPLLKNPGFQSSSLADGANFIVDTVTNASPSVPGWQALSANGSSAADSLAGYMNPGNSFYSLAADNEPMLGVVPGMEGNQCAFLSDGSAGCNLLQTFPQHLQADTDYTFTVAVGRRLSGGFGKVKIEFLGEGTVLASREIAEADIAQDTFHDFSLSYRSSEDEVAFRQIAVRIIKVNGGAGTYIDVDNVRLSAVPSQYRQWGEGYFGTNSPDISRNADPDRDGILNIFEYLLDTDPLASNALAVPQVSGDGMVFSANLRPDTNEPGFDLQYSFNLADWFSASNPAHAQVLAVRGETHWSVEMPMSLTQRTFYRFVVNTP